MHFRSALLDEVMNEESPSIVNVLHELIAGLELRTGDESHWYGEVCGSPATLTVLDAERFSMLLALRIVPTHPPTMPLPADIESLVEEGRAEVSLEDGTAWLTLYDLAGVSAGEIQQLFESFGAALAGAQLTFAPG